MNWIIWRIYFKLFDFTTQNYEFALPYNPKFQFRSLFTPAQLIIKNSFCQHLLNILSLFRAVFVANISSEMSIDSFYFKNNSTGRWQSASTEDEVSQKPH